MDDLLGEPGLLIHRHDEGVGDDVVDEVRAHAAGVAQVVDLHGCRPVGQNLRSRVLGVALEVDEDVDAILVDAAGCTRMRNGPHVDEVVEGRLQAPADVAAIVVAEAVAEDLEAAAVVSLQQLRDQAAGGVAVEVGREVAEPDRLASRGFRATLGQQVGISDREPAHPGSGVLQVHSRIRTEGEHGERSHACAFPAQARQGFGALGFEAAPVARMMARIGELEARRRQVRLAGQGLPEGLDRFLQPVHVLQRGGEIVVGETIARIDGRCPAVLGDGFGRLAHQLQQHAEIGVGLRIVGGEYDGLAVGLAGLHPAPRGLQSDGQVAPGIGAVGVGVDGAPMCSLSLGQLASQSQDVAGLRVQSC